MIVPFFRSSAILLILSGMAFSACEKAPYVSEFSSKATKNQNKTADNPSNCTAQAEQTDYTVYKMYNDGNRPGDMMPFYDVAAGQFVVYNLKNVWNGTQRHPIYAFVTQDFASYGETGEVLACGPNGCDQDFALGTGAVVKNGSTLYFFYTGHNPNFQSACVAKKEGIMLATSANATTSFSKNSGFSTIYAPVGQGFQEDDNFRDPSIYYENGIWTMYVSARKYVSGSLRGVIATYTSTNLVNWTYTGITYDGGSVAYYMMECPEVFKIGSVYYLLFSDSNSKRVYYRKGSSPTGPWSYPVGYDRFEGNGMYGGRTASNGYDRYIFGWNAISFGNTDAGAQDWSGNLVVHKLYQKANGDLAVTIPHTQQSFLSAQNHTIVKNSQWGNVTNTVPGTHSFNLVSTTNFDVANVLFNAIDLPVYRLKTTVSYSGSGKDFGFMIGACDGWNDFFSLRFIPSEGRVALEKVNRSAITSTSAVNDCPFYYWPGDQYNVEIIIENSMLVVYLNNQFALSCRIYKASNTRWGIFADNSNATFANIVVTKP